MTPIGEQFSTLTSDFQCEFLILSWWFGISDCDNTATKAIIHWNHHSFLYKSNHRPLYTRGLWSRGLWGVQRSMIQLMPYFPPNVPLSQSFWGPNFPLRHPSKISILGHWNLNLNLRANLKIINPHRDVVKWMAGFWILEVMSCGSPTWPQCQKHMQWGNENCQAQIQVEGLNTGAHTHPCDGSSCTEGMVSPFGDTIQQHWSFEHSIMWTRTYIRNHPFPSHIRLSLHALTRQKSWFNPWLNMPYIDLPFPPHWYMPLTHLCHLSKWLNCGQTKSAQSTFNCNIIGSTSKIESKSLKIIGNQCTQRFLWVGWSWAWGSIGRTRTDIAAES